MVTAQIVGMLCAMPPRPGPVDPATGSAAGAASDGLDLLLARCLRTLRHEWTPPAEGVDLAPHQGRALRIVAESGPLRLRDLADRLRIAPRSATEVADALEQRGLVSRAPDPDDRRAVRLAVTSAGQEAAEAVAVARAVGADAFFARLPASDRVELHRILTTLLEDERQ